MNHRPNYPHPTVERSRDAAKQSVPAQSINRVERSHRSSRVNKVDQSSTNRCRYWWLPRHIGRKNSTAPRNQLSLQTNTYSGTQLIAAFSPLIYFQNTNKGNILLEAGVTRYSIFGRHHDVTIRRKTLCKPFTENSKWDPCI